MPNTVEVDLIIWSAFFPCDLETIQSHLPQESGVYILYTLDQMLLSGQTIPGTAFYVGQAYDLQQQLLAHLSLNEPNEGVKARIGNCRITFGTAGTDMITGIQKHVFDTLHPSCNMVDPGGMPIPVHYLPTPGPPSMN